VIAATHPIPHRTSRLTRASKHPSHRRTEILRLIVHNGTPFSHHPEYESCRRTIASTHTVRRAAANSQLPQGAPKTAARACAVQV